MDRRKFIRSLGVAMAGAPFALHGMPMRVWRDQALLQAVAANSDSDRVLVIIQLHGGNDGLNTVIPANQYADYYNLRPNLALPETGLRSLIQLDSTLPDVRNLGLHPDMTAAKEMYDQGNLAVIQNVSYPYMNGSHFRSRDVWFMGGGHDDYYSSGWMGRYLDQMYPNYPDDYPSASMPDPLAIEIGNGVSLAFHRDEGIPLGLSIQDPIAFYNLINNVGVAPPISFPDSYAGDEIEYIMQIENEANTYAGRLREVFLAGSNSAVDYPMQYPFLAPQGSLNNPLSAQLKIIARLLSGGCKTRIFLCRIGGFDTHANQVQAGDTTMGHHAALLYHLFSAVKAFHEDLQQLGLGDRVMSLTTSEFGRRAYSNGSFGSDHGNAAPVFVFGQCVKGGVYGDNANLSALQGGNIPMQHDYRQIATALIADWFGASPEVLNAVRFTDWLPSRLGFVECVATGLEAPESFYLKLFPNPAGREVQIRFPVSESGMYVLEARDMTGRLMYAGKWQAQPPYMGILLNIADWPAGVYIFELSGHGGRKWVEKLVKS